MTITQILELLYDYGHFRAPQNQGGESWNVERDDLSKLALGSPAVKEAIRSYQDFLSESLEPIAIRMHGRPAIHDGELDPATAALLQVERCGCPDYYVEGMSEFVRVEEAIGAGSWPANCLGDWKDTHAITININKSGMQSWLSAVFESHVWPAVQFAYAEIGLMLVRQDGNARANLQSSFPASLGAGGAIGLAIVPSNPRCGESIWNRYKNGYKPVNIVSEWTTLIKHELGHNMGMGHSRGGVMNPSIVTGLPVSWKGDPSEATLRRYFGGEPVVTGPPEPRQWVAYRLEANDGKMSEPFPIRPPITIGG